MTDPWTTLGRDLGGLLEARGYRRSRLTFTNASGQGVIRTMRVERFRWNAPGFLKYQLIIGVDLATGSSGEHAAAGQDDHYTRVLWRNAGWLWGDESKLWDLPTPTTDDSFAAVRVDIERRILPFLDACDTLDHAVTILIEADGRDPAHPLALQLAIALARLGRTDESRAMFGRVPGDPALVRQLAANHGVDLSQ